MAGGLARAKHAETGKRVRILDRHGGVRTHPLWDDLDYIVRPGYNGDCVELVNGPGARPYITEKHADRWVFDRAYRAAAGEIKLYPGELDAAIKARHYVIVEPHLKRRASPNKDWGWTRWSRLVFELQERGIKVAQIGPAGTPLLSGVRFIETPTFRRACAVLAQARASVLPEGGLHHAAAALGKRAVVLFGGYIGVETTGYAAHVNLGASVDDACGMRVPCAHCKAWMERIDPGTVLKHIQEML